MPLSGAGTEFTGDTYDVAAGAQRWKPPAAPYTDVLGAVIQNAGQGSGTWLRDQLDVELNNQAHEAGHLFGHSAYQLTHDDPNISIEEANQRYGLNLKPNFATQIHTSLAADLARRASRTRLNDSTIEAGNPDLLTQFAGNAVGSVADPLEGPLNFIPIHLPVGAIGGFTKLGKVARVAARLAESPVLRNPWVSGVIEGGGVQSAISSGIKAQAAHTLGRDYSLQDAGNDVLFGAAAGGILQGGLHTVGSMLMGKRAGSGSAMLHAQSDFANGEGVNPTKGINRSEFEYNATKAREDLTAEILKGNEPASSVLEPTATTNESVQTPQPQHFDEVPFDFNSVKPLPASLSKSAPRFGNRVLTFDNDLDKALYIIGKEGNLSKAHDKFVAYVQEQLPHMSESEIKKLARDTRDAIVQQAKTGTDAIGRTSETLIPGQKVPRAARPVSSGILENPEVDAHLGPLERRLLSVTDPEGFKTELAHFAENHNANVAKLGDLLSLPKEQRLLAKPEIDALQHEILFSIAQANEILPSHAQLSTDIPITQQGIFRKDALTRLTEGIGALNKLALDSSDEAVKVATLQKEFDRLKGELKQANQSLKQAMTKNLPTKDLHNAKVAELTPQVQHAQALLQAFGQEAHAPELTLGHYIMNGFDGHVNEALDAFLKNDPEALDHPVYRVRKQVFDNVMRRLHETSEYLKSTDPTNFQPSRFPENLTLLSEVNKELAGLGDNVDPDKIHEALFKKVNENLNNQKALGIFEQKDLERFDKIEEDFKKNVEKTNAWKEGALQAQICALGGVED